MTVCLKRCRKEAHFYFTYSYKVLYRLDSGREVYYSSAAKVARTSFKQDTSERPSKVLIEDGVDYRVQCGVHVAQPEGYGERLTRDITINTTYGDEDIEEEEW